MAAYRQRRRGNNARTDPLIQTDFTLRHEIVVKEGQRLAFEANIHQHLQSARGGRRLRIHDPDQPDQSDAGLPLRGRPGTDWGKVMNGYNYIDALNGTGAFAGVQSKLTLASRYGMPNLFQQARNIRLAVRFTF